VSVVVLTFLFESEIFSQMSTFMVSSQQKQRLWVEAFQRPEVKDTLKDRIQIERKMLSQTTSRYLGKDGVYYNLGSLSRVEQNLRTYSPQY